MGARYTDTGKERRRLRAEMHGVKAVVQVGKAGLEAAVIESARQAIEARELIKISVGKSCEVPARELAEQLAGALEAEVIEVKGRSAILFRPQSSPGGVRRDSPLASELRDQ